MRQNTEQCLKKYAVKTLGNKGNIEAVEAQVPPEDELIYIAPANMKVRFNVNSTSSALIGAIAITPKNIYLYNMANKETAVLPMAQAVLADFKANGLSGAKFTVTFSDMTVVEFTGGYQKMLAVELHNQISRIIAQNPKVAPATPPTAPANESGTADELRKFKSLLDDGIITEDEYEAKKKQLLGL